MNKYMRYLIEGTLFYHGAKKIIIKPCKVLDKGLGYLIRNIIYRKGKIQENKIFIMTFDNNFSCNPKYIAEELIAEGRKVDIVWAVDKIRNDFPPQIRQVKRGSIEMFNEQASAKVWIDNALNCLWYELPKKKGQIYINTWHGSMGIKKLSGNRIWKWHARNCDNLTDYCITNSQFEEDVFRGTFWKHVNFLKFGHARNDILLATEASQNKIRDKVVAFYHLNRSMQIALYAPTFRDKNDTGYYDIDFISLHDSLKQRFGGDWVILSRAHFKNRKKKDSMNYVSVDHNISWLLNGSLYPDMQELMVATDVGITDYSSWAYDFILTKRPLFIYAPDIKKYDQDRGFYYPIQTTPFPIAYTNDQLSRNIKSFDKECYLNNVNKFLADKGCYEDGKASVRIAEKLMELMGLDKLENKKTQR